MQCFRICLHSRYINICSPNNLIAFSNAYIIEAEKRRFEKGHSLQINIFSPSTALTLRRRRCILATAAAGQPAAAQLFRKKLQIRILYKPTKPRSSATGYQLSRAFLKTGALMTVSLFLLLFHILKTATY